MVLASRKPLLYAADNDNYAQMARLARAGGCPLAVRADRLEALAELTSKITDLGCSELVLDSGATESADSC